MMLFEAAFLLLLIAGALALAPYLRGDFLSIRFPWWVAALLGLASAEVFWRMQRVTYRGASR